MTTSEQVFLSIIVLLVGCVGLMGWRIYTLERTIEGIRGAVSRWIRDQK